MSIGSILSGVGSLISAGSSIAGSVLNAQTQQKALDQQKKELEANQKNIADANARQDKAEGNAISGATNSLNKNDEKENTQDSNSGILSTPSLSSNLPMERV